MATLTIRMPDATHERLKHLAKAKKLSVNKLIEEFSTAALAEFDAETRFLARFARGSPKRGLAIQRLIAEGHATWNGKKPRGAGRRGPLKLHGSGPTISDMVLADRR